MSASLVGSEMCIRDRESSSTEPAPLPAQPGLAPLPHPCSEPPPARAAVSYTHLTLPTICSV
eukprot:1972964-Alexandrium_andersonii.AAC.1